MDAVGDDLGATVGNIINCSYKLMSQIKPDAMLILGDTNSCLSAIPAKRLHIPIFPESVEFVGGNAKMNEFQAAMGICNLRHLDREIAKRRAVMERYNARLSGTDGIILCPKQKDVEPNYAYYPVVFEPSLFGSTRNEVFAALAENGIGARKYFYPLTNTFDCFHGAYDIDNTPVALHISKRVLTLPLYADLSIEDVDRICDVILSCRK